MAIFTRLMLDGKRPVIYGDGMQTRDYLFVADAVDAFVRAAGTGGGKYLNVGTGRETTVVRIFKAIADEIGFAELPVFVGFPPGRSCPVCARPGSRRKGAPLETVDGPGSGHSDNGRMDEEESVVVSRQSSVVSRQSSVVSHQFQFSRGPLSPQVPRGGSDTEVLNTEYWFLTETCLLLAGGPDPWPDLRLSGNPGPARLPGGPLWLSPSPGLRRRQSRRPGRPL